MKDKLEQLSVDFNNVLNIVRDEIRELKSESQKGVTGVIVERVIFIESLIKGMEVLGDSIEKLKNE